LVPLFQRKGGRMSELDGLDRNIRALQQLQRVAWQQLADRSVTNLESRDLRTQLKQTSNELRDHLEMKSQRALFRRRPAEGDGAEERTPNLGLLA
jgi:hypothetical protein